MSQMVNTMEQELPLIIYANVMNEVIGAVDDCPTFYKTNFGFSADLANALCTGGDF